MFNPFSGFNRYSRLMFRLGFVISLVFGLSAPGVGAVDDPLIFIKSYSNGVNGVAGLGGAAGVAVSPDGNSLYVAGFNDNALAIFQRDPATGNLGFVQQVREGINNVAGLRGPLDLAVSPDGRQVYVANYYASSLLVFNRDTNSGALTQQQTLQEGVNGVSGLAGASAVAISPDGGRVYATGSTTGGLVVFNRAATSGALTHAQTLSGINGLAGVTDLVVSPDPAGRHVYLASTQSNSVFLFTLDNQTGLLTYIGRYTEGAGGVVGLLGAYGLAMSPDGAWVYATGRTGGSLALFARNGTTGGLTQAAVYQDGNGGVDGLAGAQGVIAGGDGNRVYVAGGGEHGVAIFEPMAGGGLQFLGVVRNGENGVAGIQGAYGLALDPEDAVLYVSGQASGSLAAFAAQAADLSVSLQAPTRAELNSTLQYQITVQNLGPNPATGVALTHALPAEVNYLGAQPEQGSCQQNADSLICQLGDLGVGNQARVTVSVTPNTETILSLSASASSNLLDPQPANDSAVAETEVLLEIPRANLTLSLTETADPVNAGGLFSYIGELRNAGPRTATDLRLTQQLPGNASFVAARSSQGGCAQANFVLTCNLGNLEPGADLRFTVDLRAPASQGSLSTRASVVMHPDLEDPNLGDNEASETTEVAIIQGDVEIAEFSADRDTVPVGETLTYLVAVGNRGTQSVNGVVLTNTLPSGMLYISANAERGLPDGDNACLLEGGTVTCQLGTLDDYASPGSTNTVRVTVSPSVGGNLTHTAEVRANITDLDPDNNRASLQITASGNSTDLAVALGASPNPAGQGSELTYTATVTNQGNDPATDVGLSDILPAGMTFVSATPSQGACSENNGTVTCTLGEIAAGNSAEVGITVVPENVGFFNNRVTISSSAHDTNAGNNSDQLEVEVTPARADLSLEIELQETPPINVDTPSAYSLTVRNQGPDAASGIRLVMNLPPELLVVSTELPQGECALENQQWVCTLERLSPGTALNLRLSLMATQAGGWPWSAEVSASQEEPNPDDNRAEHILEVAGLPKLTFVAAYKQGIDGVEGLQGVNSLALSPDGRHLYATGFYADALVTFSRHADGSLEFLGSLYNGANGNTGLDQASAVTVGAGGLGVFATGYADNSLVILSRDATSGALSPNQTLFNGEGGINHLLAPYGVLKTGAHVYVAAAEGDGILHFSADTAAWAFVQGYINGENGLGGLDGVNDLAISPDGDQLYAAALHDNALAVFNRDPASGALSQIQVFRQGENGVTGISGPTAVTVSPDGRHLYVGGIYSNSVALFQRGADGRFAFIQALEGYQTALAGITDIAIGPDGTTLYTAASSGNAVGIFQRDPVSGQLSYEAVLQDGVNGVDGLGGVQDLAISADGIYLYAASLGDNGIAVFRAAQADLAVSLQADSSPALVGETLTYTVTVQNLGPNPATGVTLRDILPANVEYLGAEAVNGSFCATENGQLTCRLPLLPAGQSHVVTLRIKPTVEGTLVNQVSVSAGLPDPDAGNNSAELTMEAVYAADLALNMSDRPDPTAVRGELTYTLDLVNQGPGPAEQIQLTNTLPEAEFLGVDSSQGTCGRQNSLITCQLGSLPAQEAIQVTIRLRPTREGNLINRAEVSARQLDPDPGNNSAEETTQVRSNVISGVYDNTDKVLENHIIAETGVVFGGALSGAIINQGLLRDLSVLPGTEVSGGGRLAGSIVNQGIIRDAHLEAGTVLSGGTLRGSIVGTPESPALVAAAYVDAGTRLAFVILDNIAQINPAALPGEGVRFFSNANIPAGIDLSGIFPIIEEPITLAQSRDLNLDVLVSGGNLLADLNAIPLLRANGVVLGQRRDNGYLTAQLSGLQIALIPWQVKQAVADPIPGMIANPDNSLLLHSALGREAVVQPALQSPQTLRDILNQFGLLGELRAHPNGNVTLEVDGSGLRLVFRPDLVATPAPAGNGPGQLHLHPSRVANHHFARLVFTDGNGQIREQFLYPMPLYHQALKEMLSGLPGVGQVVINGNGWVSLQHGGLTYRGQFDYPVIPGAPPPGGTIQFRPYPDINQDGYSDFLVVFPNGDQQFMFFLPPG